MVQTGVGYFVKQSLKAEPGKFNNATKNMNWLLLEEMICKLQMLLTRCRCTVPVLCCVVCAGSSMCVKSLLSHGADPGYGLSHLGSPLYISCLHRQAACSEILLRTGQCRIIQCCLLNKYIAFSICRLHFFLLLNWYRQAMNSPKVLWYFF